MPLIKCKVEPRLRWAKHCVFSVPGVANADNHDGTNSNDCCCKRHKGIYFCFLI